MRGLKEYCNWSLWEKFIQDASVWFLNSRISVGGTNLLIDNLVGSRRVANPVSDQTYQGPTLARKKTGSKSESNFSRKKNPDLIATIQKNGA